MLLGRAEEHRQNNWIDNRGGFEFTCTSTSSLQGFRLKRLFISSVPYASCMSDSSYTVDVVIPVTFYDVIDISVGTVTRLRFDDRRHFLLQSVQTASGVRPAFYSMVNGRSFPRSKAAGVWGVGNYLHIVLGLRMNGAIPSFVHVSLWR